MIRIGIIVGSTRPGRNGGQVAGWVREDFAGNTEFRPQQLHIEEMHKLVDELLAWNTALAPLRAAPRAVA